MWCIEVGLGVIPQLPYTSYFKVEFFIFQTPRTKQCNNPSKSKLVKHNELFGFPTGVFVEVIYRNIGDPKAVASWESPPGIVDDIQKPYPWNS